MPLTPPSDLQAIGQRLIELRERAFGMNQAQFARLIGVAPQALLNWERGYNRPSIDMAYRISVRAGGVTVGYIFTGDTRGMPGDILSKLQEENPKRRANSSS